MLNQIALLLLATLSLNAQCTDGCMKCVQKTCQYCDLQSGYRLSGQKCEKFVLENCEYASNLGTCLKCATDFHLDTSTKKCIKILSTNIIENCQTYNGIASCAQCLSGFFLESGKCVKISSPLTNCLIENSQQLCLQCNSGFVLDITQKVCVADPKETNCATYKNVQCDACSAGYFYNKNSYLSQLLQLVTSKQRQDFLYYVDNLENGVVDTKKFNSCVQIQVTNCLVLKSFNLCSICANGYFLTELGQCQANPEDRLANCEEYSSLVKCSKCQEGYWLDETSQCQQVKEVKFCAHYMRTPLQSDCKRCEETHFLIGQNKCVPRDKPEIINCSILNAQAEICAECLNTFRLTDDFSQCLPQINDCLVYDTSNYLTASLSCKTCAEGFYYNETDKFCVRGVLEFCRVYQRTEARCQRCENKYYLENGICIPHDVIPSCEVYHPLIKNVCFRCNYETFLFKKVNSCEAVTDIPNCLLYKDRQNCSVCKDNYYLIENQCELIPASENCVRRSGTQCGKCLPDFVLEDGICRDPNDYIVNECEQDNLDGTTDYRRQRCMYCKSQRVPFNYKDSFICVEVDYMKLLQKVNTLDSKCLQYIADPNQNFTCTKCQFPYVILDGVCVAECPPTHTLYKQLLKQYNTDADRKNEKFAVDRVNQCGPLIPECRVAAPDLKQNDPDRVSYTCITCTTNSLRVIDFPSIKNQVLVREPFIKDVQYGKSPVSFNPPSQCFSSQSQIVLGEVNSQNLVDNCSLYQNLGLVKGCVRCAHGYSGVVLDIVNQCEVYTNNQYTCKQCIDTYYLASPYECRPVEEVQNCLTYSKTSNSTKCTLCSPDFYVANDMLCALRSASLNKPNCTAVANADSCTCTENYFNSSNVGFECVQKPSYCLQPVKVNNVISCDVCDSTKSFKQGGLCIAGSINKCVKYKESELYCLECENLYFVQDGTCVAHDTLNKCDTTSKNTKNTCEKCDRFSVKFAYQTRCVEIAVINNCLEYDSTTTCLKCESGYRLENLRKRCMTIDPLLNCLEQEPVNIYDVDATVKIDSFDAMDQTKNIYDCKKCAPGYYKIPKDEIFQRTDQVEINGSLVNHPKNGMAFTVNVCVNYTSSLFADCHKSDIKGDLLFKTDAANGKCEQCKAGTQLDDLHEDRYVCLDRPYLSKVQSDLNNTNCRVLTYTEINGQKRYSCTQCEEGYFQSTTNPNGTNTCSLDCPTGQHKITGLIQHDAIGKKWHRAAIDNTCAADADILNFPTNANNALITNCGLYTSKILSGATNKIACVKCKDGFLPVMSFDNFESTLITEEYKVSKDPYGQYLGIKECVAKGEATYAHTGNFQNNVVPGCSYYGVNTTVNKIYCFRCEIGQSGVVLTTTETDPNNNFSYISECSTLSTCDINSDLNNKGKFGRGLHLSYTSFNSGNLLKYFSCYKCINIDEVPLLHIQLDAQGLISQFNKYDPMPDLANDQYNENVTNAGKIIDCRKVYDNGALLTTDPTAHGYKVKDTTNNTNGVLPLNCAIGVLNTNSDGDVTTYVSTAWAKKIGCLACRPGFAPIQAQAAAVNAPVPVDSCNQIQNCTNPGTYLNGCETCIHYYDYFNTQSNKLDFTKCVKPRPNDGVEESKCYAAYSVGKCQICQAGYAFNPDGHCVAVKPAFCKDGFYNQSSQIATKWKDVFHESPIQIANYVLNREELLGCNKCKETTQSLVKINAAADKRDVRLPQRVCTPNPLNPLRKEIENCSLYGWSDQDNKAQCLACDTNFVLTMDHQCSSNAQLSNCTLGNERGGSTCLQCESGYLNVGGVCVQITANDPVDNCAIYDEAQSKQKAFAICTSCKSGFWLAGPSKCEAIPILNCATFDNNTKQCLTCIDNYQKIVKKNGEQYCYKITLSVNTDNQGKCLEWDNSSFQLKKLKCNKCSVSNANAYLVANTDVKIKTECMKFSELTDQALLDQHCKQYDIETGAAVAPSLFTESTFRCLACDESNNPDKYIDYFYNRALATCNSRNLVANCKQHSKEKDGCEVCNENFILQDNKCNSLFNFNQDTLPTNFGYIQSCTLLSTCDNTVRYEGLDAHVQSLASCHKCLNANQIPFIAARTNDDNTIVSLQEYGLVTDTTKPFISGSGERAVQCLSPTKTSFNVAQDADFVFPTNCGLGLINTKKTPITNAIGAVGQKQSVYCVSCKPGFRPVNTGTPEQPTAYLVQSCEAIPNCESSLWFNYCSQCDPNYSYKYVEGEGVKYDTCVNYTEDTDCYAVDNSTAVKKCAFCRQGYIMNVDGRCEGIIAPRCSFGRFDFKRLYTVNDLAVQLVLQGDGPGCQQCDDGFVGMFNGKDEFACTASPYHIAGKVTATSKYLYKCKHYKLVNTVTFQCKQCEENYVLGVRGKCHINTNLLNCALALDDSHCRQCNQGFVNVDRKCVVGTIDKCNLYANYDQSYEQLCIGCEAGFFLRDNKCVLGLVNNCQEFKSENICLKCKQNFGLLQIKLGENYCFPIDPSLNCKEMRDDPLQSGSLMCQTCESNAFTMLYDPQVITTTSCLPFIKTENCIQYEKSDALTRTSFDCLLCEKTHYLSSGKCLIRTTLPKNCTTYKVDKDECETCAARFFLSQDAKSCTGYPEGTPNCQIYLSLTECLLCEPDFYLRDKKCIPVPDQYKISNCVTYEDLEVCETCEAGFLKIDGICVKANAQGCSTYKTINSCATCPQGSAFVLDGFLLNCVAQQISNCQEVDLYEPYPCLLCQAGFYLLDGKCNSVGKPIENCIDYSAEAVCKRCAKGFALDANKTSCLQNANLSSLLDSNCEDIKIMAAPVCNTCAFGHVFKHGYCLPCSENTLTEGCLNCDSQNQKVCLICQKGYYQNSNGKCYKNGTVPPEEVTTKPEVPVDPQVPQEPTNESVLRNVISQIFRYFVLIYLL